MALSEQTTLQSIEFIFENNTISVRSATSIKRGQKKVHTEVICVSYSQDMKAQFLADVPNGQVYVTAMGW